MKKWFILGGMMVFLTGIWYNLSWSLKYSQPPRRCTLAASVDAISTYNVQTLMLILQHKQPLQWFAHGGHAISAIRIGSPVMYFDREGAMPVSMDLDYDFQILVPNQTYWVHQWGPMMNKLVKKYFKNKVYTQSKIYPKNSYKLFHFCPTNKRIRNPVGHGAGNACIAEMRPLFLLNETHVTSKQQCTTPPTKKGVCQSKHIYPFTQIFPLKKAKWDKLEIPVPRDLTLVHTLDLEINGRKSSLSEIYWWEKLFKVASYLKTCNPKFTHYCPDTGPLNFYNEKELQQKIFFCQKELFHTNFSTFIPFKGPKRPHDYLPTTRAAFKASSAALNAKAAE